MSITLKQSNNTIYNLIKRDIANQIAPIFSKLPNYVVDSFRTHVRRAVMDQPEWASIDTGGLRGHLGLPDGRSRMEEILDMWLSSIKAEYKSMAPRGNRISGGIFIQGIVKDYKDVLSSSAAIFITEKGVELPWLDWLLRQGSKDIIRGYFIGYGRGRASDRIMIKSAGRTWGVPMQFQGDRKDNFILRAIEEAEPRIIKDLEELLNASLRN